VDGLTIDLDDRIEVRPCTGCGGETRTWRGYVYEEGDAFAIYFAQYSPGHADRVLALDVAIGDWNEDIPPETRRRVGLHVRAHETEYRFTVADPEEWLWSESDPFGRLMARDEAVNHPQIDRFYRVAEFVIGSDPRINSYLEGGSRFTTV
jgi:hypothetical protein